MDVREIMIIMITLVTIVPILAQWIEDVILEYAKKNKRIKKPTKLKKQH